MDSQGYLPITLIASFHRVQALTDSLSLIIESVTGSEKIEFTAEFKVRPKHDPTKWPLLDDNNDIKKVASQLVPPPPLPKTLLRIENLNPDVPEFIPEHNNNKSNNNMNDSDDNDNNKQNNSENNPIKNDNTQENGRRDEENWREVKRKNKENKGKKETKSKSYEREELEFYFDEELDNSVPPSGRQNTFSNEG